MLVFMEALWQGLVNLARSLHPRQIRRYASVTPIYLPLAAGMTVYLLMAASSRGLALDVSSRTRPMDLPSDVVILEARTTPGSTLGDLEWTASVERCEVFRRWSARTSVGERWVLGLAPGSGLWPTPAQGVRPGPGEVLVPVSLTAGTVDIRPGDIVEVGRMTAYGFTARRYAVSGFFEDSDDLFHGALVLPLEDLVSLLAWLGPAAGVSDDGETTGVALWARTGDTPAELAESVKDLFTGATFLRRTSAAERAYRAVGGFLSPQRLLLTVVFILTGLGVFNVMLLTLLQRKVQLGVVKALGADDDEVFFLLILEGGLTAASGTLLGLAAGSILVQALNRVSETTLALAPSSVVLALVLALLSFYLASWLPATLCRRATPIQLMAGRRLYLDPRSTCAQCGRCGGF